MTVLAIINAKGGSGKSTVATTISAYAAKSGIKLMMGDLDPQQSIKTWLRLRPSIFPVISSCLLDSGRVFRTPLGFTHAILDTPSGLSGHHLARVVMASNLVIVPVATSVFDRVAAEECIENIRRLPRVVSGLCVIAILGIRMQKGSLEEIITRAWAASLGVKFLGVVRYSQFYITLVDSGSSVFDDPEADAAGLREDWAPVIDWLCETYFESPSNQITKRGIGKVVDEWPRRIPGLSSFKGASKQLPPKQLFDSKQHADFGAVEICKIVGEANEVVPAAFTSVQKIAGRLATTEADKRDLLKALNSPFTSFRK